ncbi:hypothetical protein CRUP_015301 [Coryphaenoides rupestris]|nr:hypothetical protein CRUP_015301 [Coryphaenoides rupestris]
MVENRSWVLREGVYRWFSSLTSARRTEFLCGLLDLCVPIELRFLGSCLEDLARKDYNSLRDAEIKANNPADLSALTDITDEVVRSKLLVSLALLASDNREAAGVLYRTLTHIDTVINNYGLPLNDVGQTEEQFLLLFTMASNHPAFSFHQKQLLRRELRQIQEILQKQTQGGGRPGEGRPSGRPGPRSRPPSSSHPSVARAPLSSGRRRTEQRQQEPPGKTGRVVIQKVEVRSLTRAADDPGEYTFEAHWLDGCVSSVVRTQQEVAELLSQRTSLAHAHAPAPAPSLPSSSSSFPSSPPSLPPSPPSPPVAPVTPVTPAPCTLTCSTKLATLLQYRGANSFLTRSLPQLSPVPTPPTVPSTPHGGQHAPQTLPLPLLATASSSSSSGSKAAVDSPALNSSHSYGHATQSHPQHPPAPLGAQFLSHSHCQAGSPLAHPAVSQAHASLGLISSAATPAGPPEPSGILDWLRRLRLHKYYPVFKELTMFLALTEEDLNKYDLTQGAKKKLKTQLELQNHMRPSLHPTSTGELRVEVDAAAHHQGVPSVPREGSSCSGYPSSVGSPRSPLRRSTAFERTKELHRPLGSGPEKDRTCVLLLGSSSGRPTAQVLPVQTDPPPSIPPPPLPSPASCSSSTPSPSASSCHPAFSLGSLHPHHPSYPHALLATSPHPQHPHHHHPPPPPHLLGSPRKLRPLPPGAEDRGKAPGLRLDGLFTAGHSGDGLQDPLVCRGLMGGGAVGLMVDTSSALTSTSNSLHHVSHPPVHFHLSSAPSPSAYYSYPAGASSFSSVFSSSCFAPYSSSGSAPSSSSSKQVSLTAACNISSGGRGGGASYVPMVTGNNPVPAPGSYCSPPALLSSPSPSPPSSSSSSSSSSCSSSLDCSGGANTLGHGPSACACSSCGCHGSCGVFGALPGYAAAGYLRPFSAAAAAAGPSLFTLGPLLHFSPLIASSSSSTSSPSNAFSYPLVAPQALYHHGVMSHDMHHHHQQQQQLHLQQGCGVYASHEALRNGGAKRAPGANLSCYNCGVGGHRAEDCKQPPMDAQQGTFRLKYIPRPDSQDSGD